MYRDDVCAVCGESLPPDHLYCREHAAQVDDLLHEIGDRVPALLADLARLADLVSSIHPETWDYLAEQHAEDEDDEPVWPPASLLTLHADGGDVDVDVDTEPGMVTVEVRTALADLLRAVATTIETSGAPAMAAAASEARDAGATH